ncbi:MAG TPA: hypothetical protein VMU47_12205 [Caldimonas sp.]|nr:hypothetical protein [Caldimonas sp.]
MDARDHSAGAGTPAAQRLAQIATELHAAASGPLAELVSAMPIVILVRAVREALADRPRRAASFERRHIDAG